MSKKNAQEKTSRAPVCAILCAIFFALAAVSVYALFDGGKLHSIVRGLGGSLRFVLPLVWVWPGVWFFQAARGNRISVARSLGNAALILIAFSLFHLFSAQNIDRNGYYVSQALGWGDFLVKSYERGIGGGAIGAILCWPIYKNLGVGLGVVLEILLLLIFLALTGHLKKWILWLREQIAQRNERRADENFELDRQTAYEAELPPPPPRRRAPHQAREQSPVVQERARPASKEEQRPKPARRPARSASTELQGVAEEPKPRSKPRRRMYNEVIPESGEDASEEAFSPVVTSTSPIPEPFKPARPGRLSKAGMEKPAEKAPEEKAEDLTIEPDEYELPDEDAAPFDLPSSRKGKPLPKIKRPAAPAAQEEEEEAYNYPPIDLLSNAEPLQEGHGKEADLEKARLLCDTLKSFGIDTRLTGIAHGPAVTRFELQPAPGVKVSRITALSDDIALNLAAESVRIEAPIPGKAAVGVEIPNDHVETVALRDVLESAEARRHPSRVAVGLGKDNSGRYIVADIAKMPHVLIAGQTGSGKSVCINALIISILYRATPDEVKLILIDPKVVELSVYNGIPHLIAPVVTDPKKAASALEWAVSEMSTRYKKFAERGVRDIKGYNKALPEGEKQMPQMVIIIDELADLMMVAPGEVEESICRLAQLARAAGMHLVIATQRPSVNVITGVIKANIPTRIAFSVASQVDSRTMIDHGGAEKLLGNGDMLFVPSGINKPMRVQGAWVSDQEVHQVTEYIKTRHETSYDEDVVEKINQSVLSDAEKEEAAQEYDPRLAEAVEIVIEAGQASISMLQRRMRVGYARAGRLIDEMAQRGIVSEADGAKPRNVLVTREQFEQMFEDEEDA